jgi:plasmid stabilization system protein ParE
MKYNYVLLFEAQLEYEASLSWYMERSLQASENFVDEINSAIQLICQDPKRWRNKYKNFFEFKLKIFPFTIIYWIEHNENLIIISSIFHNKRNPRRKYRRPK